MSSSKCNDGSPQQNYPANSKYIRNIIEDLTSLLERLKSVRERVSKGGKRENDESQRKQPERVSVSEGSKEKNDESQKWAGEMDRIHDQLDKGCKELEYVIHAFGELENFKAFSRSLEVLQGSVSKIQDLNKADRKEGTVVKQIEKELKVLRSNITQMKIQIPLKHQFLRQITEARRQSQTTNSSLQINLHLPKGPYEGIQKLESCSLLKEFQDRYEALDDRQKLCLLCFAIFPENAEVKERLLKFWWDGERLIDLPPDSDGFVNETLQRFVEMGFIEPVTKKSRMKATSYKMTPIIRSVIIRLAKKANLFDYNSDGKPTGDISASKKSCLVQREDPLTDPQHQPKGEENHQEQKDTQQPEDEENQQEGQKQEKKVKEPPKSEPNQQVVKKKGEKEKENPKDLEELQTLFNVSLRYPESYLIRRLSKMRSIGVLYLGTWESKAVRHVEVEKTEFLKGLKNMKKLRFFSLQGISGISKLPKEIGKLTNLRILDLRACHNLKDLPKQIGSLKVLTVLDLSECYWMDNMPKQVSQLTNLKVLKGFVISEKSSCTLDNLAELHVLEKLSINVKTDNFKDNGLFKFTALKKLKIAWKGDAAKPKEAEKPQEAKPGCWSKLRTRKPGDNKDEKAKGSGMRRLEKLDLQCFPQKQPPTWLDPRRLTSLKRLYISRGELSKLGESSMPANQKWEVNTLRLKFLTNIKTDWKELSTQFPKLKHLEKVKCPRVTFCPCDAYGVWKTKQP